MGARARRRARTALWVSAVAIAGVGALGALALYLAPRVLPNLETTLAPVDTVQTVAVAGAEAELTVPAGWTYHRSGDDELLVRSPDGRLALTVRASASTVADAFADEAESAPVGTSADERLASGLEVRHADDPATGLLVAAVGPQTGTSSAQVVAHAPADALAAYRAVIAGLLESVRVRG